MSARAATDFLDESTTTGRSVMSMSDVAAGDPNTDYALSVLRHGRWRRDSRSSSPASDAGVCSTR